MQLDIRLPIGLLFGILGLLLAGFGAVSNKEIYARSAGWNINLAWGIVLLVFGIVMILLGRRGRKNRHSTSGVPRSDVPVSGVPGAGASGGHGH